MNYVNAETDTAYASFSYVFSFGNDEMTYSYKKTDVSTILAETVCINGKTILAYDKTDGHPVLQLDLPGTENLNRDLELIKISVLKYIKSNTVLPQTEESTVLAQFFAFVDKMLLFWSLENRSFIGYTASFQEKIVDSIIKRGHFEDMQQFFAAAGFPDSITHDNRSGTEQLYFLYPKGKMIEFTSACSTGMSSLLLLYYWLEDISDPEKCPSFLCIDEFDAFYHYELSRFVVERLKKCNSQVMLTTHNTSLLSNDILRPDCYFLVYRDKIINLSNTTAKELRQAHNIEKMYRAHAFETE